MLIYIGIICEEPHKNHAVARIADRHFLLWMPLLDIASARVPGINVVEQEFLAAEEALPTRILNHIENCHGGLDVLVALGSSGLHDVLRLNAPR